MQGISDMTDYFVVCHGNNERQVQSIARAVKEAVHEQNIDVKRMEGYNDARWVLIDLANVVVHIFHKDERNYYNIEKLYQDAPVESYGQAVFKDVQYEDMSLVYDQLTQDQPYDEWFNIVESFSKQQINEILDLGCGTGSLTHRLVTLGHITGMDLSIDMLTIANEKSNNVRWLEGDMTDFNLNQKFNVITIFCDSLNYLSTIDDVRNTFKSVYQHLTNDGVFL